jgi:hypothetical protein
MSSNQVVNGKALEYAFLIMFNKEFSSDQNIITLKSESYYNAEKAFYSLDGKHQAELFSAADVGVKMITRLEPNLLTGNGPLTLSIQKDAKGKAGDVRDVLVQRNEDNWCIGISCKHNHDAVKHSRLSGLIDVGKSWFGFQSTNEYFSEIRPIFYELGELRRKGVKWDQIDKKDLSYYKPILQALINELKRLDLLYPGEIPRRLLKYFLGRPDFYKTIVNRNKKVLKVQGFNLTGTLNQDASRIEPQIKISKLKLPTKFYYIDFVDNSTNKAIIAMDQGWSISLRIHNASKKVESSLKLDVRLEGLPQSLYQADEKF